MQRQSSASGLITYSSIGAAFVAALIGMALYKTTWTSDSDAGCPPIEYRIQVLEKKVDRLSDQIHDIDKKQDVTIALLRERTDHP